MENLSMTPPVFAFAQAEIAWHAGRPGNERRGVGLLAASAVASASTSAALALG